jgi:Uncharacterized protein conserved in bacteria (DUF2264)
MGAFWAAVAMAEIDLPVPFTPGVVKGLLLRHLRAWTKYADIFYPDGTLNIGFVYSNMYMCEDYNSPQSPYWCMKAFVMLALPEDNSFWFCEEEQLPSTNQAASGSDLQVKLLQHPKHILVDSGNHHFLLSSGQYCGWPLKATEAKYCKFAYSSTFGFSVPTGPLIQQMAPDSTLALSIDNGETWRVRWRSEETSVSYVTVKQGKQDLGEQIPSLVNIWYPSKASKIKVTTTLIPPTKRWADWHIRVHRVEMKSNALHSVAAVEGGFALYGQKSKDGRPLTPLNWDLQSPATNEEISDEGVLENGPSALILSEAGASGIRHIFGPNITQAKGVILKPDSNTNLMVSRTLMPTIQQKLFQEESVASDRDIVFATAVFAVKRVNLSTEAIRRRWLDWPSVRLNDAEEVPQGEFIQLSTA